MNQHHNRNTLLNILHFHNKRSPVFIMQFAKYKSQIHFGYLGSQFLSRDSFRVISIRSSQDVNVLVLGFVLKFWEIVDHKIQNLPSLDVLVPILIVVPNSFDFIILSGSVFRMINYHYEYEYRLKACFFANYEISFLVISHMKELWGNNFSIKGPIKF